MHIPLHYDNKIRLYYLTERPRVSHGDGPSRETSIESKNRQGTETPASIDFDIINIDPRLIRPGPITVVKPSTCLLGVDISVSSSRCQTTSTDSKLAEISTRRVTRGVI